MDVSSASFAKADDLSPGALGTTYPNQFAPGNGVFELLSAWDQMISRRALSPRALVAGNTEVELCAPEVASRQKGTTPLEKDQFLLNSISALSHLLLQCQSLFDTRSFSNHLNARSFQTIHPGLQFFEFSLQPSTEIRYSGRRSSW